MKFIKANTAYGVLESTIPPWSVPAWNSLFSGVKPEKLGLYSFVKKLGDRLVPALKELDDQVYVWDIVSMYGKKVVAVNIPCVANSIPVNGFFIAGFLADRNFIAWPSTLTNKLHSWKYIVDVTDLHPLTDEEYLEICIKTTIKRTALFLELIRRVDWSLGIIVYTCSDRIQHRFLKTRFSFVEKYYEVLDRSIAKLLNSLDLSDTAVFIVSDHGFKVPKAAFSVNTWLAGRGYLELEHRPSTRERLIKTINYIISNNFILLTITRLGLYALMASSTLIIALAV
jgi:predicted AlkP superfamily phosphohydrolase/phosphomutase